jgi:hypothetical protein
MEAKYRTLKVRLNSFPVIILNWGINRNTIHREINREKKVMSKDSPKYWTISTFLLEPKAFFIPISFTLFEAFAVERFI